MIKYAICANPECGLILVKNGRKKYCTYQCGDILRSRTYRGRHPDRIKAATKKKWIECKDILIDRHARWAAINLDHRRKYNREYRERIGAEHFNCFSRRWYRENRVKCLNRLLIRKAQKNNISITGTILTPEDWELLQVAWDFRCAYCRRYPILLTQDHIVPLSKGGQHTVENVLPACKSCNSSKFDRDLGDFLIDLYERLGCNPWAT